MHPGHLWALLLFCGVVVALSVFMFPAEERFGGSQKYSNSGHKRDGLFARLRTLLSTRNRGVD